LAKDSKTGLRPRFEFNRFGHDRSHHLGSLGGWWRAGRPVVEWTPQVLLPGIEIPGLEAVGKQNLHLGKAVQPLRG
jgi:hypothetical protein